MPTLKVVINFHEIIIGDKHILPTHLDFTSNEPLSNSELVSLYTFAEVANLSSSTIEEYLNSYLANKTPKNHNFFIELYRFSQSLGLIIGNATVELSGEFVEYFGNLASMIFLRTLVDFQGHLKFENFCNYLTTSSNSNKLETITGVGRIQLRNSKIEVFGIKNELIVKKVDDKFSFSFTANSKALNNATNYEFKTSKGYVVIEDQVQGKNKNDNFLDFAQVLLTKFELKLKSKNETQTFGSKYFRTQNSGKVIINIGKPFDLKVSIGDKVNFDDLVALVENKVLLERIDLIDRLNLKKNEKVSNYLQVLSGEFAPRESLIAQKKNLVGMKNLAVRNLNSGIVDTSNINSGFLDIIDKSKVEFRAKYNAKLDSVVTNQQITFSGVCKVIDLAYTNFTYLEGEIKVIESVSELDLSQNQAGNVAVLLGRSSYTNIFDLERLGFSSFLLPTISIQDIIELQKSKSSLNIGLVYGFGQKELSEGIKNTLKELNNHFVNIENNKFKIIL